MFFDFFTGQSHKMKKITSDDCRAAIESWLKGDRKFVGNWKRKLKFKDDNGNTARMFSNFEVTGPGWRETWLVVTECQGELNVRVPTEEESLEFRRKLYGD